MKKFLIILFLITSSIVVNAQFVKSNTASYTKKIDLKLNSNFWKSTSDNIGPVSMIGGATFLALGLTTSSEYNGSTSNKKSFFKQPTKLLAVATGSVLLTYGIVITINKDKY